MITESTFAAQSRSDDRATDVGQANDLQELSSIEFRVVRSGLPARRMRLNTTRCTLGSGEGCTVRLNDPSLRPMHAVILRDSNRVLLRAYTVPIEVNGHLTGEAFLHLGDQFTLGSYHFELTESPDLELERPSRKQARYELPSESLPLSRHESRSLNSQDDLSYMTELPLRVASTPMSFTDSAPSEVVGEKQPTATPARSRMSFLGGGTYVSEALQAFSASSLDSNRRDDVPLRSSLRADADQLRQEVESWRKREQRWKEKDREKQAELDDAVTRFHQSQDRAVEASNAVAEMRTRMAQLTEELAQLANESAEFRQQASQRHERLREAADSASQARLGSLQQRDEATREYEAVARERDLLRLERDQILASHDRTVAERNEAISQRDAAQADRDQMARLSGEQGKNLNRSGSTQAEMTEKIRQLSTELDISSEQLRSARTELSAAYARVETLAIEAEQFRNQLISRDQIESQQSQKQKAHIEALRTQVTKLEADCAAARLQATYSTIDPHAVESLQSQLELSESSRNANQLSWEQEAAALQENIRQMSLELASVTGRMSQAEVEHEATKSELINAHTCLTMVQHELTVRPTSEQWEELQRQLANTEKQLTETEQQLGLVRRDYDELLGRRAAIEGTTGANAALPITAVEPVSAVTPEPILLHNPDVEEASIGDHGWPTYQDSSANDLALQQAKSPGLSSENSELGSLAKRLIAQLNEAKSAEPVEDDTSASISQSHGAWSTSSTLWERVSDDAEATGYPSDFNDNSHHRDFESEDTSVDAEDSAQEEWQRGETPSIWKLPTQFVSDARSSTAPHNLDPSDKPVSSDFDDEPIDQTFMLSSGSPVLDVSADGNHFSFSGTDRDDAQSISPESHALPGSPRVFDFHSDTETPLSPQQAIVAHEEAIAPEPEPVADPDDDSIEAYMNRLLKRVQGHGVSTGETPSPKPVVNNSVERTVPKAIAVDASSEKDSVTPVVPLEAIDPNAPLIPRSQAPEHAGNMAAMREIANATADNAISQSVRGQAQQLKSRAVVDLIQAGVVLVCAAAFYACGLKITSLRYVWFTAAGLAGALAFFFFIDMLKKLSLAKASYDRANSPASNSFTEDN